jgi:hypothetical protein
MNREYINPRRFSVGTLVAFCFSVVCGIRPGCLCVACAAFFSGPARAQSTDDVLASLVNRTKITKTIYYKTSGTRLIPKGVVVPPDNPPHDHKSPIVSEWKVDFENNWVSNSKKYVMFNTSRQKEQPYHVDIYFDGVTYKQYGPFDPATMTELGYKKMATVAFQKPGPKDRPTWYWNADLPLFYFHGYFLSTENYVAVHDLKKQVENWIVQETRPAALNGVTCIVVKCKKPDDKMVTETWFDPQKEFAPLKVEVSIPAGTVRFRFDISAQKTGWGWIPKTWSYTQFDAAGGVEIFEERVVEESAINERFESSDFEGRPLQAGDLLSDRNAKQFYKVEESLELTPLGPAGAKSPRGAAIIAFSILGVLVVCGVVIWYNRRRKAC